MVKLANRSISAAASPTHTEVLQMLQRQVCLQELAEPDHQAGLEVHGNGPQLEVPASSPLQETVEAQHRPSVQEQLLV